MYSTLLESIDDKYLILQQMSFPFLMTLKEKSWLEEKYYDSEEDINGLLAKWSIKVS